MARIPLVSPAPHVGLAPLSPLWAWDAEQLTPYLGQRLPLGCDEVGRGCLMGPVVAAAVVLKPTAQTSLQGFSQQERALLVHLNDSKQLNPQRREALLPLLHTLLWVAVAEASVEEIATLNIRRASHLAAYRAATQVLSQVEGQEGLTPWLWMDGRDTLPEWPLLQSAWVKGDGRSALIAAASVVAKQARDAWVEALCLEHPAWAQRYGWATNKGYGTALHRQGLALHGVTSHHRLGFKLN